MKRAIIVDWTHYKGDPTTQKFIVDRVDQCQTVLLVTDPNDTLSSPSSVPEIEWDVIIRNSGMLNDVKFKQKAFSVLSEVSNLDIVIAFDESTVNNKMYRDGNVLITLEDFE